jgi:hypothetical protein
VVLWLVRIALGELTVRSQFILRKVQHELPFRPTTMMQSSPISKARNFKINAVLRGTSLFSLQIDCDNRTATHPIRKLEMSSMSDRNSAHDREPEASSASCERARRIAPPKGINRDGLHILRKAGTTIEDPDDDVSIRQLLRFATQTTTACRDEPADIQAGRRRVST